MSPTVWSPVAGSLPLSSWSLGSMGVYASTRYTRKGRRMSSAADAAVTAVRARETQGAV